MKQTIPPDSLPPGTPDASQPIGQLVVCMQGGISAYPLSAGRSYSIGRGGKNDIVISHDAVSRHHAVVYGGPAPAVEDLGSRNGTRVDGRQLEPGKKTPLTSGTAVEIGPATLLVHTGTFAIDRARESHHEGLSTPNAGASGEMEGVSSGLVLRDERMIELYRTVEAIAAGDISVLVLGETGAGKELLAQALHSLSPRHSHEFVKFNSAALPEQLVESELFGYERGAFTGADKAKAGLFEAADNGTLFLDEVGDLSMPAQAKLLRVLETGEILRVGAVKPRKVSVRFISATNRDFRTLIAAGSFRKDLFYRLNGVTLRIPPLRERPLDIPALVDFFAARAAGHPGRAAPRFAPDAMAKLVSHRWPGNVRELRNVVERAALLARGAEIAADELHLDSPLEGQPGSSGRISAAPRARSAPAVGSHFGDEPDTRVMTVGSDGEIVDRLKSELARQERSRILDALARANGNQTVAADLLGISRRTLLTRLDAYAIPRPRKGRPPKP